MLDVHGRDVVLRHLGLSLGLWQLLGSIGVSVLASGRPLLFGFHASRDWELGLQGSRLTGWRLAADWKRASGLFSLYSVTGRGHRKHRFPNLRGLVAWGLRNTIEVLKPLMLEHA